MSYRCTPNLATTISAHNSKILKPKQQEKNENCNCRKKDECPLEGNCLSKNVIYQATIKEDGNVETYVGLTSTTFKTRWTAHKSSFKNEIRKTATTLSQHIWRLKSESKIFSIGWKLLARAQPFSPVSGLCQLCTKEKYFIIFKPHMASLNSRNELASCCRHKNSSLLRRVDPKG